MRAQPQAAQWRRADRPSLGASLTSRQYLVHAEAPHRFRPAAGGDSTFLMKTYPRSAEILRHNRRYIPGGVVSVNRATSPEIVFDRGEGPWIWDVDGNRYLDYHAAFAPHFLGHNDPYVTGAVRRVLDRGASL